MTKLDLMVHLAALLVLLIISRDVHQQTEFHSLKNIVSCSAVEDHVI